MERVTLQTTVATNNCGPRAIGSSRTVIEYGDYAEFGGKWVPRLIKWTRDGAAETELHLVRLRANPDLPKDVFADLPGYEAWPYCDSYSTAQVDELIFPGNLDPRGPTADAFYVIVGSNGKAREVRLINPSDRISKDPKGRSAQEWVHFFLEQRYEPATCDARPVLGYFLLGLPLR